MVVFCIHKCNIMHQLKPLNQEARTVCNLPSLCCLLFLLLIIIHEYNVFRWFKFTLKPPYSIAHDKLRLAIWDTSFWTFLLKFGHKGPWDISSDLFWSFLKYVNFWRFQGHLSTFQKMGGLRKSKFSRWRSDRLGPCRFRFRRRGPYMSAGGLRGHGPICFPIWNT